MGLHFTGSLPQGLPRATEALYVIALKDSMEFYSEHLTRRGGNIIPTYKSAMVDIMIWLIQISADRRTESFHSYEIQRN